MTDALYEADLDLAPLLARRLAIVGYGNHGRSHALNLRDYGVRDLVVALRPGSTSRATAEADGFPVVSLEDAAAQADAVSVLAADEAHREIVHEVMAPHRKPGQSLLFAHGFSVEYGLVTPPDDADVVLAAAKGPGGAVRSSYLAGGGLVGFWAVAQNVSGEAEALAKAYLKGVGCGRAGVFETSFAEEALADILGEQAVLVGGMTALARAGYQRLVAAGVSPRMAYIDTVHELKYIADLIQERGVAGMAEAISDTAEFGGYGVEGEMMEAVGPVMDQIVADVVSGDFARRWLAEHEGGGKALAAYRARAAADPMEAVGAALRAGLLRKTG